MRYVYAPRRLVVGTREKVRQDVRDALDRDDATLDLSVCEAIDSSGLGMLLTCARYARQRDRAFVLAAPRPDVLGTLRITKLDLLFTIQYTPAPKRP